MNSLKNWEEDYNYTKDILDKLPIEKYLIPDKNLDDIMDEIEEDYKDIALADEKLHGYLFNLFSTDDFIDYIWERFDIPVIENYNIIYKIGHKTRK